MVDPMLIPTGVELGNVTATPVDPVGDVRGGFRGSTFDSIIFFVPVCARSPELSLSTRCPIYSVLAKCS